jgi:hypothetical protein
MLDSKDTYTRVFLNAAGLKHDGDIEKLKILWWQNLRSKDEGGLRLTDLGIEFIKTQADIKVYEIKLPKEIKITAQILIWLDQFITSPWYLSKNTISVLSEKSAFELYLFSGDVKKMGHAKAMSKRLSQESVS